MSNPYDPVTREELLTRYLDRPWQPAWAELGKLFASTLDEQPRTRDRDRARIEGCWGSRPGPRCGWPVRPRR
jgi:hypothetical protein